MGLWEDIFGSDQSVSYESSPEQSAILQQLMPLIQRMSNFGLGGGTVPYQIPDISAMMPQAGWMENMDPNIVAGAWEPYNKGADMLENRLSGRGTLGNARAGMSGAAADVMSQYQQTITPQVTSSLWNMVSPALNTGYNALLQREQAPYNMLNMTQSMLPTGIVNQGSSGAASSIIPMILMKLFGL